MRNAVVFALCVIFACRPSEAPAPADPGKRRDVCFGLFGWYPGPLDWSLK